MKYMFAWLLLTLMECSVIWCFGGDIFHPGGAMGMAALMAMGLFIATCSCMCDEYKKDRK